MAATEIDDRENAAPERIGPYRVEGRVGKGGMGEVYRGYDDRLDRPVALKRVKPDASDPETARRRFRREARAVARLSHGTIVQIFDWVADEDGDWIVMELVVGRSLREILAGGPLPPAPAARIARDVAAGLAAAHEAGIVHRDLKAENVMVTAASDAHPGRVKILDFGLAKRGLGEDGPPLSTISTAGMLVGTVPAMSPEQAFGHPVDHRSDLFSLGTLLYELLTGVSPFRAKNAVETLTRVCSLKQSPARVRNPGVPDALSALVQRLLEKEPARRPQSAREVAAALEPFAAAASAAADGAAREGEQLLPSSPEAETLDFVGLPSDLEETPDFVDERLAEPEAEGREITGSSHGTVVPRQPPRRRRAVLAISVAAALLALSLAVFRGPREAVQRWFRADGVVDARSLPSAPAGAYESYVAGRELLRRFYRKGNLERAVKHFEAALAADNSHALAYAGLAQAYWRMHDRQPDRLSFDRALEAAKKAVELGEHLAVPHVSLAMILTENESYADASRHLEQARVLDPLSADIFRTLGDLHAAEDKDQEAAEAYRKALELDPDDWLTQRHLGTLFYNQARFADAEAAYLEAKRLAPDYVQVYRELAAVFHMQGRYDEAAAQLQRSLEIEPSAGAYSNLGVLHFFQGRFQAALEAFEKAVALGANDWRRWGNLADAYRWTPGNEARAHDAYLRAIQLADEQLAATPGDLQLRSRRALYLAKRGDLERALEEIRAFVPLAGDDPFVWYRAATALEISGDRDSALAALEKAVRAGYSLDELERDPELEELRRDVRYHRLASKAGEAG